MVWIYIPSHLPHPGPSEHQAHPNTHTRTLTHSVKCWASHWPDSSDSTTKLDRYKEVQLHELKIGRLHEVCVLIYK